LVRLQRQILRTIRAEVRRVLGPQSPSIRRYYDAYKREFRGSFKHASMHDLVKSCLRSDIVFMGDYHTFSPSQKSAFKLLRELAEWEPRPQLALGLEMVPSEYQDALDQYLIGAMSDAEFLKSVSFGTTWGFRWENYKPLLELAKLYSIPLIALNSNQKDLAARDAHAARILAEFTCVHPKHKIFVLFGDLHLARGHLPKQLRLALKEKKIKRKVLLVYQNSESLYWRLTRTKQAHSTDVLSLGRGRYCIMNAAPWVKLQSYLEWAERIDSGDLDEADEPNLHEIAHDRLKQLAAALNLTSKIPPDFDFTIQTANDLAFLEESLALKSVSRSELKALKYRILGNRTAIVPQASLIYVPSVNVNSVSEGVMALLHAAMAGVKSVFHDPDEHFYAVVVTSCISYFGSKILNHRRKCDLEDDFKIILEKRLGTKALAEEKLQKKIARLVIAHIKGQREYLKTGKYRAPAIPKQLGRVPLFLETARCLGALLGEKLYASYVDGLYSSEKLASLLHSDLEPKNNAKFLYLGLVRDLASAPLNYTSKQDVL
jgi:uncharacterized iron-regulated protein